MPLEPKRTLATLADALARSESERVELIRGTLVQKIRAEPFDAVELEVDVLFGGDPSD